MKIDEQIIYEELLNKGIKKDEICEIINRMIIKELKHRVEKSKDKQDIIYDFVSSILKDISYEIINSLLKDNNYEDILNLRDEYLNTLKECKN